MRRKRESAHAKGRRWEKIVARFLETQGYLTHLVVPAKFMQQDIFGIFDIVVFKDGEFGWVQVTTKRMLSAKKREFSKFPYWHNQFIVTYDEETKRIKFYRRTEAGWGEETEHDISEMVKKK